MDLTTYVFGFIEGILTFISPCILPLLPVYMFYMAGTAAGEEVQLGKNRIVKNALGFVVGFTIVFMLLGAAATALGMFLQNNLDVFRKVSGILMIVFGLYFVGIFKLKVFETERKIKFDFNKLGFLTAIVFGMVFAFGWSPCSGPFLLTALTMAASYDTVWQGLLLLFLYSMGIGIPFLLVAVLFDKLKDSLRKIQKHLGKIKFVSGVALIIAGLIFIF